MGASLFEPVKVPKATWMTDGSHWPGTWSSAQNEHSKDDHAGIIQAMLTPPNSEPVMDVEANENGFITTTTVRERRPGYDHDKKAGAMNALVRTSAIMSNGPFILNLDCDYYVYNSQALREGMCLMLNNRVC
ncbi:hypothetical protein IEQ34_000854 [Dendrobium chrysotoxum]|uniref:Uncharacterized protein n=1 Tax=Dendrobium chrysotoxum TaxID=161865 RepID=A0AAV7HQ84_DENCH|nr:hypothetical protein IEQ34_000854 [Dendrobium chrysotoxum]